MSAATTRTAELREGDYFGPVLNRAARLLAIGHGGQILLSQLAASLVGDGEGFEVSDLGQHRLRDLTEPEQVFQLNGEPRRFPALSQYFSMAVSEALMPASLPGKV